MKHVLVVFFLCTFSSIALFSQSPATAKGAGLVTVDFSFLSQGGDLYFDGDDNRQNLLLISPNYLHFLADRFAVGGGFAWSRQTQGDVSINSFAIGPSVGYYFDSGSSAIPYLGASLAYATSKVDFGSGLGDLESKATGTAYSFGGGILVRKGHLGFTFETGFVGENLKNQDSDERIRGNSLYFTVGIVGLLHKTTDSED